MIIGLLKEIKVEEYRVALTPAAIQQITKVASMVFVENNAGVASGFSNKDYEKAGAVIIESAEEIWQRSELIIKVKEPQQSEFELMREKQIVLTYFHFAGSQSLTESCLKQKITALAYETLVDSEGGLPLLMPMSAIAGKMAAHQGAKYLERQFGGKGILMGGLHFDFAQVAAAKVLVLGGGIVGTNAAQVAAQMGADVSLLELNLPRIEALKEQFNSENLNITVLHSNQEQLKTLLKTADIIIGAVLVAGAKAPKLISKEDLSLMQLGTVLIDVAIDQGGCFATSRATTHNDPIYIEQGMVHYCVANLPGAVCRSSSQALCAATLPYILQLLELGLDNFLAQSDGHKKCLNMKQGQLTLEVLKKEFPDLL